MAPQVAERLSALARDHAEGRMSLEAYRRLRGPLLDGLAGITDESASVVTQPRVRRPEAEQQAGLAPPTHRAPPPRRAPGWSGLLGTTAGRARLAGLAGAVLVIVALLIWHGTARMHVSSVADAPGSAGTDPIQALLQPLIDDPDWSDARLRGLNDALLEAGPARLAAVRSADWFNAFVEQVRSRVKEQQALAGAPLSPDKSALAALAVTLGIDLASPDRPVRIGAEAAQAPRTGSAPRSRETLHRDDRGR